MITEKEYLNLSYDNDLEKIKEYNKQLIDKYPWLGLREYDLDTDLYVQNPNEDYECSWLDCMPAGWRLAFGLQMCEEIDQVLRNCDWINRYCIVQIKEKFGGLRWYDNGGPEQIYKIIDKYENLSYKTCIVCGKPSKLISKGWISPYCYDCSLKDGRENYQYEEMKDEI